MRGVRHMQTNAEEVRKTKRDKQYDYQKQGDHVKQSHQSHTELTEKENNKAM